ncbi:MAG: hypothetical protein R3C01_18030 [Planctomycetaceae bacterium]
MVDLNHPKVKRLTREIAISLAIAPTFVDFVFAEKRPECFRYWVEDINGGWTCYVPDEFDVAFPLWSTNADQTLILVKGSTFSFGKGWHDNPDMEMISTTTQGLLSNLLIEIAESDVPNDDLRQAAAFCGYRFVDDLLAFIDGPMPEGMSWSEAKNRFIATVDAKSR